MLHTLLGNLFQLTNEKNFVRGKGQQNTVHLIALQAKQATSTKQEQEVCSAPHSHNELAFLGFSLYLRLYLVGIGPQ